MISVEAFLWDEVNEEKVYSHGIHPNDVDSILDGNVAMFRNRNDRRASYVFIGRSSGGRWITVPAEEVAGIPGVWRPVTAWLSKPGENNTSSEARVGRMNRKGEDSDFEEIKPEDLEPIGIQRALRNKRGTSVLSVRFDRGDLALIRQAAAEEGLTTSEYVRDAALGRLFARQGEFEMTFTQIAASIERIRNATVSMQPIVVKMPVWSRHMPADRG